MRIAYFKGERQPLLGPNDATVRFGSGGVTNIKSVFWGIALSEASRKTVSDRALPQSTDFIFVTPPEPNFTSASFERRQKTSPIFNGSDYTVLVTLVCMLFFAFFSATCFNEPYTSTRTIFH